MKNQILFILFILTFGTVYSQTGINTQNPNDASSLDISSSMTVGFGGLKLPTVTDAQKATIVVTSASDGMMLFVVYPTGTRCLEIYDGIGNNWQQINCMTPGPTVLFSEDFNIYSAGTGINSSGNSGDYPSGVSKWTLTDVNTTMPGGNYSAVQGGVFEVNNTDGPIQLETQSIDITGYSNITFSLDLFGSGPLEYNPSLHGTDDTNSLNDYINVSYSINGGGFITIPNFNAGGTSDHTLVAIHSSGSGNSAPFFPTETVSQTGLNGSTLVIRVTFQNWAGDEFLNIDNIIVTGM